MSTAVQGVAWALMVGATGFCIGYALRLGFLWRDHLQSDHAVLEVAEPAAGELPRVGERAAYLVLDHDGAFGPGLRPPLMTLDDGEALAIAKRWSGVVARIPLVADYRDDARPAPEYRSKVRWVRDPGGRQIDGSGAPGSELIPPGGSIVIEHQDTEDNGSVTIWFRTA